MSLERQKTILLVEDEAIIAMAEKITLEKFGYAVIIAITGEEAIEITGKNPAIDLILMDINLGSGMDGTEAAAFILKERDLPVVFLSSHTEPEVVEKTEKITSYGYVVKNSSSTVLDASIKMAFKLFEAKIREKEKETALAHSRRLMQYVIEHMRGAVAVHDRELRYIFVSQRYLDEYKLKERDIIGKHHYDIFPDLPQKWRDAHQRALAGEISRAEDDPYEREDGSMEWTRWECRPWYEADGSIGGIIIYTEVTTERKLTELKLAQNLDLLTKLARLVPGVIYQYRLDPDGRSAFPYASPGMNDIYEVTPEEVREDATPVFGRLHPDDYDMVAGAIQASALTLNTFYCEFRVILPRQGLRWRWSQAHPERLADGGTLWHGIISDITERKQAEDALRASEERFRGMAEQLEDVLFTTDHSGTITYISPSAREMFGWFPEEMIGRRFMEFLPEEEIPRALQAFQSTVTGGEPSHNLNLLIRRKDNSVFHGELKGSPMLGPQGIKGTLGLIRDVSEHKRVEEALRLSEAKQSNALQMTKAGHWEYDVDSDLFTFNDNFYHIFRTTADREGGYRMSSAEYARRFCHPDDAAQVGEETQAAIASSDPEYSRQIEHRILYADGEIGYIAVRFFIKKDARGRTIRAYGVNQDITERKRAEDRIKSALSFQQALLDAVPSPIFYKDANLAYIGGNQAFEQFIGMPRKSFIGKTVYDVAPADLAEKYDNADKELLENQGMQMYEASVAHADGTRHEVVFHKAAFTNSEGRLAGLIGVIIDITEHKQAQVALQEINSRLELAMQAADMAWWEMDLPSGHVSFAKRKAEMLGYSAEKFKHYQDFVALVHPDDREKANAAMRGHLDGSLPRYEVDYRIAASSGETAWFHDIGSVGKRDANGKPLDVTGLVINISERKRAEQALLESKERYESFISQSSDGVYRLEMDVPMPLDLPLEEQVDYMYHHLHIAECNAAFLKMYEMRDAADILGKSLLDMHGGADNPVNRQTSRRFILDGYRIQHAVTEEIDAQGTRKYFSNNSIGILENGRLTRMWGAQTDISDRVQMEAERRALQEIAQGVLCSASLREFLAVVHAAVAAIIPAENFFVALFNKESRMFEEAYMADKYDTSFPPSRLEKSLSRHVFLSSQPLLLTNQGQFAALEATGKVELVGTRSPSWLGVPLILSGETIGVMVLQDYEQENRYREQDLEFLVSIAGQVALAVEHKRATEEVKRQLEEKNVLLKEVHHRIKNNFASISGLLSLHMQASTSAEAVAAFQDAIGRIDSMRLLYEKLLLGGNFQDASVKNYIESLATSVVSLFPDLAKVRLNLDVDDFKLEPKRIFPLGIIINELLTNIMKHAFAGRKSGTIKLSLAKDGDRITLTLQDNGVGLPSGFDIRASKGFGLTLVKMLSQQLKGTFSIEKHKGTRCRLEFDI